MTRCGREREPDDQRIGGVQARHRRKRVRGESNEPGSVVQRLGLRERVGEAEARKQPGRRGRQRDVAHQADRVRDDDGVPRRQVCVVPPEVDPEERKTDDDELGEPVGPVDRMDEKPACVDDRPLEPRLEQRAKRAFHVDHPACVRERLAAPAVREPAGELVRGGESEPDRELTGEIPATVREDEVLPQPAPRRRQVATLSG
jgi:hypothetical protein